LSAEDKINQAVITSLTRVTGKSGDEINPHTKLVTDLEMESIDILDLLFEIEKQLKVSVDLSSFFQNRGNIKFRQTQFDFEVEELVRYIGEVVRPK
jgi:acyl carrier protein